MTIPTRERFALTSFLVLVLSFSLLPAQENNFEPLFDGKTLQGWVQQGGKARYEIRGNTIVGTSVPATANSFLCTERDYSDFILELEFLVDAGLNSGVQIRSQVFAQETTVQIEGDNGQVEERRIPAGRVHGYQVEIDTSDRAWTGGIYDEARRGWLVTLEGNEAAQKAFRQNEWNHFRIEARGSSIKTWLNGVPAAELSDDMTLRGFIALQVHGVGDNPDRVGKQVRWRNIGIRELAQ